MRQLRLLAAFAIGLAACGGETERTSAVSDVVSPTPAWVRSRVQDCVQPNDFELERDRHELRTLELFPSHGAPRTASVRYFSLPRYRYDDEKGLAEAGQRLCSAAEIEDRLLALALGQGVFERGHLFYYDTNLARRLGPRDQAIVDALGRTAFYSFPIDSDGPGKRDVRPLARTILAEFGAAVAAPYGEQAFRDISVETPMGTSAAQLAIAARYPGALERVARLMSTTLARAPDPIPREGRDRLLELSYALAFAGEDAQPHLAPVLAFLDRDVESWAPPFGMITLKPSPACIVLDRIGGPEAAARRAAPPCDASPLIFPG